MLKKWIFRTALGLGVLLAGPAAMFVARDTLSQDWRSRSNASIGVAPTPAEHPDAIVQVWAARTVGWRGAFGVHSWVSVKPSQAANWTSYHIIGWRARRGGDGLATYTDQPDRRWFGAEPALLAELTGPGTDAVIGRIVKAAAEYPYRNNYVIWPGPNSNTFTAHIAREVPELRLDLPPTAIGKDFLGTTTIVDKSASGTGFQLSLWGLLGLTAAVEEGVELNLAGLTFGLDPLGLGVKLPGIGRLGPAEDPVRIASRP